MGIALKFADLTLEGFREARHSLASKVEEEDFPRKHGSIDQETSFLRARSKDWPVSFWKDCSLEQESKMDEKTIELELDADMLAELYDAFKSEPTKKAFNKMQGLLGQTFAILKFPSEEEQKDEISIYAFQFFLIGMIVAQEWKDMGIKFLATKKEEAREGEGEGEGEGE